MFFYDLSPFPPFKRFALLELTSIANHSKITVKYEGFSLRYYLPSYHINNLEIENGFVKSFSSSDLEVPYGDLKNILNESIPFYFFDVNFDKKEELIIVDNDLDPDLRENKFFEITSNDSIKIIDETVVNSLSNYNQDDNNKEFLNAKFDEENKDISITSHYGDPSWWDVFIYRLNEGKYNAETQFVLLGNESHDRHTKLGYDRIQFHMAGQKDEIRFIKLE